MLPRDSCVSTPKKHAMHPKERRQELEEIQSGQLSDHQGSNLEDESGSSSEGDEYWRICIEMMSIEIKGDTDETINLDGEMSNTDIMSFPDLWI